MKLFQITLIVVLAGSLWPLQSTAQGLATGKHEGFENCLARRREGQKMREHEFEREFWHLLAAEPGIEERFKRRNVIVISLLAFLLLGVIVAGLGSEILHKPIAAGAPQPGIHQAVHRG